MKTTKTIAATLAVALLGVDAARAGPTTGERAGRVNADQRAAWPLGSSGSPERRVLFVREGAAVPARVLLALKAPDQEVQFQVMTGGARFIGSRDVAVGKADRRGAVALPELRAGPAHDESSVAVSVQGRTVGELRVRTIAYGAWDELLQALGGAIVERGPDYAIVDETKVDTRGVGQVLTIGATGE